MARKTLSGCVVIKNGVVLGYPFIESILSLLPVCDEYVVVEGFSEDDTYAHLQRLAQRHPKIRLFREAWPQVSRGGSAIGEMQTRAFRRCRGRWCYLLQADEVMPCENLQELRRLCAPRKAWERIVGRRRFNSYAVDFLHVNSNFQRLDLAPDYRWAVRLVRNRRLARRFIVSESDGWAFAGRGCMFVGTARLPRAVWHVGYNFPLNTYRKQINQGRLYPDVPAIQASARRAQQALDEYQAESAPALEISNPLQLPPLLQPLIGQSEYRVREELFADGRESQGDDVL